MIIESILHDIPCGEIFPICGCSALRDFHIGNSVLIWLIYGTSARSTLVRDRHHFSYIEFSIHNQQLHWAQILHDKLEITA
jgi:hypothetical protein